MGDGRLEIRSFVVDKLDNTSYLPFGRPTVPRGRGPPAARCSSAAGVQRRDGDEPLLRGVVDLEGGVVDGEPRVEEVLEVAKDRVAVVPWMHRPLGGCARER
jgi:hypothetical protein